MKLAINATQYFLYRALPLLVIVVLLSACSHTTHQAPIRERRQPPSEKIFQHVVARGETLFSIAWRYDLDYKILAKTNRIGSDFIIHPGQVLDLRTDSHPAYYQHQQYNSPKKPSASTMITENSSRRPHLNERPFSKSSVTSGRKKSPTQPSYTKPSHRSLVWRWPIKGRVISKFSGAKGLNKGIDIKAKEGDKVISAAAGVVVYAGSGLRGYGKLLIIKHNDIFLSAYGHNSRLRVAEGDVVDAGQHIAEAGASGTNISKLHFEIRRDGKPVNPLHYLPKDNR